MMKKMVGFKVLYILTLFLVVFSNISVSASSYTSTTNLFEGTYSNNLIDMAISQIDNFINKKFVIFQVDYNYYLVAAEDYSVNANTITFTDSTIISAIRYSSGNYNSYYEYTKTDEESTIINSNYVIISNIDFSKAIASGRYEKFRSEKYTVLILTIILGLVFAIFLTREGRF